MLKLSALITIITFTSLNACPDLTLDERRMQNSHYIDRRRIPANSCSIYECGTGVGVRLLLRFDGAIPNVGTSDLHMGTPTPSMGFVWDDCHQHYHWNHFMDYQIFHYDNITHPNPLMTGEKRAFCLRDDGAADRSILSQYNVRARYVSRTYDCDNQGIHIGFQDVYGRELECQWVDVTNLQKGRYKMRAEVNPILPQGGRRINECRYDNNVAWMVFETPGIGRQPTPEPTTRQVPSPTPRQNSYDSWFNGWFNTGCGSTNEHCTWNSDCCSRSCNRQRFSTSGYCH